MECARFNPGDYPWILPDFDYSWVFLVPGDWNASYQARVQQSIWKESAFAPIYEWLIEHMNQSFYVEQNSCRDGLFTPVEVHIKGVRLARRFALTWT